MARTVDDRISAITRLTNAAAEGGPGSDILLQMARRELNRYRNATKGKGRRRAGRRRRRRT